jgi:hypothetical protein
MLSEKLILKSDRIIYEAEKRAEKREEKRALEIAKKMLDDGIPIGNIHKTTGLDIETIQSL